MRDFRCFRDQQTARLAPLTLLVGENSTGKTSFLAALRAILEVATCHWDPDFRRAPYDLGSFPEIVYHQRSGSRRGADSFGIGFQCAGFDSESISLDATFALGDGAAPALGTVEWRSGDVWIREVRGVPDARTELGCGSGSWRLPASIGAPEHSVFSGSEALAMEHVLLTAAENGLLDELHPVQENTRVSPTACDCKNFGNLYFEGGYFLSRAFAGAPIRSSPLRTYDPIRLRQHPEGLAMPAFLANAYARDPEAWQQLKQRIEKFGHESGLFDEIFVKRLGNHEFEPFRLEVRKWGKKRKGARRNLIDVGYGVSQVLPLLVDMLRRDGDSLFLLQQPEVHLHPSAQATLGSLFCTIAKSGRQLVVETHSDYILDRILLDIRDKRTELQPDDVSILYFERDDLDVTIYSIHVDDEGNVLDAPEGYRSFFKKELQRVIDY